MYVKANGDAWPCPFVEISAGNVKEKDFNNIYYESPVFQKLHKREENLKGICGGCRGRALLYSGDYLAEDPCCFINETPITKAQSGGIG